MKQSLLIALLLSFAVASFGQFSVSRPADSFQIDYLKKSKNKKKAAWILLGCGGAIWAAYGVARLKHSDFGDASEGMMLVGGLSMLTSIPFFISAHRNKKRATSLSLKNENAFLIQGNIMVHKQVPSLSLKMDL